MKLMSSDKFLNKIQTVIVWLVGNTEQGFGTSVRNSIAAAEETPFAESLIMIGRVPLRKMNIE